MNGLIYTKVWSGGPTTPKLSKSVLPPGEIDPQPQEGLTANPKFYATLCYLFLNIIRMKGQNGLDTIFLGIGLTDFCAFWYEIKGG